MRKFDPDRKERPVVIGASEAAAACGRSRYSSALDLYLSKRGEIEDNFGEEQIEAMEMGHHLEPIILDRYEKKTGRTLLRHLPMYFSALQPFMAATPDGLSLPDSLAVDAKSTTGRMLDKTGEDTSMFGQEGTDQVPIEYLFQAQQQCHVLGVNRVDFPVMFDARTIRIYTVNRDADLIAEIVSAEQELAERIINADPPEPDFEHSDTLKLLQKMRGVTVGKVITWDDALAEKWTMLDEIKGRIKALEKAKDAISAELFAAMQDAEQAICGPLTVKRITVAATSYTVDKAAYSYLKASKSK
jgi:predicted phage-related endonuclease